MRTKLLTQVRFTYLSIYKEETSNCITEIKEKFEQTKKSVIKVHLPT